MTSVGLRARRAIADSFFKLTKTPGKQPARAARELVVIDYRRRHGHALDLIFEAPPKRLDI